VKRDLRVRELSAPGRGAVSVLAVEGEGAAALLERLCGRPLPRPGKPVLVRLVEGGTELDEALLAVHGPGRCELQVHGSPPLVRRLLALAEPAGDARAERSFESRARARLAGAQGEAAARMLLDQAEGALRRELAALEHARAPLRAQALLELARRARVARWLVDPARVVLAGPANAGKSTLFNVLLGEGRAIVHEQPGTTRDVLREPALLGAYPVWLCDTAGERPLAAGEPSAAIEEQGQLRARRLAQGADLVLWLDPAGAPAPGRARSLRSRAGPAELAAADALAALEAPEHARARVAGILREELGLPEQPWIPGAAVPFEPALADALAGLDPALDAGAWRGAVEALLGPADCPASVDALPWGD
jgi:tRNA modification GTPase